MRFLGKFRNKSSRIFEVFLINHTECIHVETLVLVGTGNENLLGRGGVVFQLVLIIIKLSLAMILAPKLGLDQG